MHFIIVVCIVTRVSSALLYSHQLSVCTQLYYAAWLSADSTRGPSDDQAIVATLRVKHTVTVSNDSWVLNVTVCVLKNDKIDRAASNASPRSRARLLSPDDISHIV